jgi:hypothetical protein
MNTNERMSKHLELHFDWQYFKILDMVLVSDDFLDYHMFMIYTKDGDFLHGYHIERIR